MRGRARSRDGAWSSLPGRRPVHARSAVRRSACFLGLVGCACACIRVSGGSAWLVKCRFRRYSCLGSSVPLCVFGLLGCGIRCRFLEGLGALRVLAQVASAVRVAASVLIPGCHVVLDLRLAGTCFKEDKVKGVAAFRFSEGCRTFKGRNTSKSAVWFV